MDTITNHDKIDFQSFIQKLDNIRIMLVGIQVGLNKTNPELAEIINTLSQIPKQDDIYRLYVDFILENQNRVIEFNCGGTFFKLKVVEVK